MDRQRLSTLALITTIWLFGCDFKKEKNVVEICNEYPRMCAGFNTDAWCRTEKSNIIRKRYAQLVSPSDENRYQLLILFESYRDCVHKASQIEHLKLKQKKNSRVEGYMMAQRELKQLADNTRRSADPTLSYYHWSRFQDEQALKRFLRFERENKLETPRLQVFLAEYYNKVDYKKTINILLHALELYKEGDTIDGRIFDSLSTLYMSQNQYRNAYIWAYLGQEFRASRKTDLADIDLSQLSKSLKENGVKVSKLEDIAESYYSDIKDGQFKPPTR